MIHPTALVNLKPVQFHARHTQTHTNSMCKLGQPHSLTLSFPPFTFPSHSPPPHTNTHACTHKTTNNHSAWPLPHDLSSLLPWQGSSDEIRMTTGMTQSVAVESLHRVKSRERVCALNKSNLLWFMGKLVCMHLWYTSSLRMYSV